MLTKGGLNFPAVGGGGGGLWWPRVARGYSSRLTVVSRGLIGVADMPGKGGIGGREFIQNYTMQ